MSESTRRDFLHAVGASAAIVASRPLFSAERALFVPGAHGASESQAAGNVLLNYNESAYGPSPRALAAVRDVPPATVSRYFPEGTYDTLRDELARHHGIMRDHIRVAAGSTEVLKACDDVFLAGGKSVVVAEPAYEAVLQYAANSRADATRIPLTSDHRHDLLRMASAVTASTGLVYVCNPNNPTGTIVRRDEFDVFLDLLPSSVTVLVDEAYSEFVTDGQYESAVRHVRARRNVVVAKTFSKIHGLAGMRIGYAIAPPALIVRLAPFLVDFAPTGAAANAALASLRDRAFTTDVAKRNAARRTAFVAEMRQLGFACADSQANFVMADLRRPVAPVIAALERERVFVGREFAAMPTFLRVTLGTEAEMAAFFQAFRRVIRAPGD